MNIFQKEIIKILKQQTKLKEEQILEVLEIPLNPEFGDYAFPCFTLSKTLKKSPKDIAEELTRKIIPTKLINRIQPIGPYINFFTNKTKLTELTLKQIIKGKDKYGSSSINKNKRIMVEYSAPNSNKPLHIGHLRNDSIGMLISNLLEFTGAKIIKANLVNDRGIHICKPMLAYQKWMKNKKPNIKSDHFVGDLYVKFEKAAKDNENLKEEAQELLKKWEKGDKKTLALWKKINFWAIQGIKQTYTLYGSKFDVWFFESEFYDKAQLLVKKALDKKLFFKDETGAIIAKLEPKLPNRIIQRSDSTKLYITQDLALTKLKFERYKLDKAIWVVGSEQNLHLQQLFKIMEELGFKWAKDCYHLSYGMVNLTTGKMKSREGTVIDADDLIQDTINLAKKEIQKREKLNKTQLEKRAKEIALSAIKFSLLKIENHKDILFDPEKAISFEGETGPYLQYSHARASSILRKAKTLKKPKFDQLNSKEELTLINLLSKFPEIVSKASETLKPHLITNYGFELSQSFNEFYSTCPVLKAEEKDSRLYLVKATKQVLKNTLKILNITPLEKM